MELFKNIIIIGGAAGSKISYENFHLSNINVFGFMNNYLEMDNWSGIQPKLLGNYTDKNNEL